MNIDLDTNAQPKSGKKNLLYLSITVVVVILVGAYLACSAIYENKKNVVIDGQKNSMRAWINGTSSSIIVWKESLDEQAKRISTSELYRLFVQDVSEAGNDAINNINSLDSNPVSIPQGIEHFVEQVPLMRSLLYDFMNYNGFTDARIVNAAGSTLLSALTRPTPMNEQQKILAKKTIENGKAMLGYVRSSASGLVVDFATPLRSAMGNSNEEAIAVLMLTKSVTGDLANFLARDIVADNSLTPLMLQNENGKWYNVAIHQPKPVEIIKNFTINENENIVPFEERQSLVSKQKVFSYGAKIQDTDWWIVLETPVKLIQETLGSLAWTIYGIGSLITLGIILLLSMLWWMSIGREQKAVADRFQKLSEVISKQKGLLDCVNVSLTVGLVLADENGKIHVVNRSFAEITEQNENELTQKNLSDIFDPDTTWKLLDAVRNVIQSKKSKNFELSLGEGENIKLFRVTLYPFVNETPSTQMAGAVSTFQDITEFRKISDKNQKQQNNIVTTLVRAIEGIDPYLLGHSRMMETLGILIGKYLQFPEADISTIKNATTFSQIGKLFVPRDILTKTGRLSPEELEELRKIPQYANEILLGIGFDPSVPQAVYQMNERMDGNGYPQKLTGDQISIHAKILAVTNAFCAMVSPRSYRSGMTLAEAIAKLKEDAAFDRNVVDALSMVILTPEASALFTDKKQPSKESKDPIEI